jgi:hypothetical protein
VPWVVGLAAVRAEPGCHQNEPAQVEAEHASEKQRGKTREWLARRQTNLSHGDGRSSLKALDAILAGENAISPMQ